MKTYNSICEELGVESLLGMDLSEKDLSVAYLVGRDLSGINLSGTNLMLADLRTADLRDTDLSNTDLRHADLGSSDLSNADLRAADISWTFFGGADLTGTKFSLEDVPFIEDIHKKVYEAIRSEGCSLEMDKWHTCETAHCRAGWIVTLAGKEGERLEDKIGTQNAALLIYLKSDPSITKQPMFYGSNEGAWEDIKRCARVEE